MRISSRLFTRAIAVLLLALALNMAAAAFMGGDVAQANNISSPQETPTVTLRPPPTNTPVPPTSPPPTSPPNQPTNTPPPQATSTPTPTPTKIVVLPQTGVPDGGSSANLALIAAALATAGTGLFVASRRTTR